ncbi:MAG: hypothetical protein ABEL76_08050 [Bradymonadaceae bacterium]
MGDDDKSWKEIDRERDKSSHVTRDEDDGISRDDYRSDAKYKQDLEELFRSGGQVPDRFEDAMEDLGPEEGTEEAQRQEAIQKLREIEGFRDFAKQVNAYIIEGHRLPDDENLLARMLDHPDNDIVRQVLEHILELSERRVLERPAPIRNRLTTVRNVTTDSELLALVDEVEEALDGQ